MIFAPLFWYAIFLAVPIAIVLGTAFLSRGTYGGVVLPFTIQNFQRALEPAYLQILTRSLSLALLTCFACLVIAVPVCWKLATLSKRVRLLLLFAVGLPFLMNSVVRVFALKKFLLIDGPLDRVLTWAEVGHEPMIWSQNIGLVAFGLVVTYLPFMIFPIYAAFEKFDFALVEAAADLGAKPWTILTSVLIPNLRTAFTSGCLLVFIPCFGEFLVPDLLGGAKTMLLGNLLTEQFLKARDWPFGAAITVVAMIFLAFLSKGLRELFRPGRSYD